MDLWPSKKKGHIIQIILPTKPRGFFPKQPRNQGTIRRGDRQSALAFGLCETAAILRVLEVEVFFFSAKIAMRSGMVDGSEIWLTHLGFIIKPCKEWDIHHINWEIIRISFVMEISSPPGWRSTHLSRIVGISIGHLNLPLASWLGVGPNHGNLRVPHPMVAIKSLKIRPCVAFKTTKITHPCQ